jgi:hypothetical protein
MKNSIIKLLLITVISFNLIQSTDCISAVKKDSKPDHKRLAIISTEMKALLVSGSMGLLYGWRYINFESKNFFVGGAGYTGPLNGDSNTGSFSMGGLVTGFYISIVDSFNMEISLLAGGGGGFIGTTTVVKDGGIALEPSIALSFKLGNNVQVSINGGYAYLPSAATFTAITGGLRFDFLNNYL